MKIPIEPKATTQYLMQHVGDVLDRQIDQILQEQLGISLSQYKILTLLADGTEQSQRTLARHLGQTEAAVSRQIALLLNRGMILSRTNNQNKRQNFTNITVKGLKVADAAKHAADHYLESLWLTMPDKQQKQLQDALIVVHAWTCQAGKLTSCDHPFGV